MPGTSNIAREMGYLPGTDSTRYLPWARKGARFTAPAWVDKIIGVQLLRQCTRSLFFGSVSVIPNFFPNLPPLSCSKFAKLKGRPWKKNKTKTLGWLLCKWVLIPSLCRSSLSFKIKKSDQKVLRWATTPLRLRFLTCQMGLVIVLNSESNCAWYELSQCTWNRFWAYNRHLTNGNYYVPFHTFKKLSKGNLTKNKLPKNIPKSSPGPGKDHITFFPKKHLPPGCYPLLSPPAPLHTHTVPLPPVSQSSDLHICLPPPPSPPSNHLCCPPWQAVSLTPHLLTSSLFYSSTFISHAKKGGSRDDHTRQEALGTGWNAPLPPGATPSTHTLWPSDAPFFPASLSVTLSGRVRSAGRHSPLLWGGSRRGAVEKPLTESLTLSCSWLISPVTLIPSFFLLFPQNTLKI